MKLDGWLYLKEDNFDGRWNLTKDDLWRKKTFGERWTLMEDDLWHETTFNERHPLTEDNLWWKTSSYIVQCCSFHMSRKRENFDKSENNQYLGTFLNFLGHPISFFMILRNFEIKPHYKPLYCGKCPFFKTLKIPQI